MFVIRNAMVTRLLKLALRAATTASTVDHLDGENMGRFFQIGAQKASTRKQGNLASVERMTQL